MGRNKAQRSVYPGPELTRYLDERAGSRTASANLEWAVACYLHVVEDAPALSIDEWKLLLDALRNDPIRSPAMLSLVNSLVEDALALWPAAARVRVESTFGYRIKALSRAHKICVVDVARRFWRAGFESSDTPEAEAWLRALLGSRVR